MVTYKGSTYTLAVPDPQLEAELAIPVPAVSLAGDVLQVLRLLRAAQDYTRFFREDDEGEV